MLNDKRFYFTSCPSRKVATFLQNILPCERRVLEQCVITDRIQDIADALNLSYDTVQTCRKRLLRQWCELSTAKKKKRGKHSFQTMLLAVAPWLKTLPGQKSVETAPTGFPVTV